MITVTAVLDASGLLKSCDVRGHAGAGKRGNDIVCAAVSVLARTAQIVLSNRNGIIIRSEALRRGVFTLETEVQNNSGKDYLAAIGTFLLEGLRSVAEEYPENCVITITKERRN
ncbi:MAG: ribosomal-processing cysteine protease Prp [Treponema sp.]|nr:ribosomal-processing cysteine protease Prp [Treponema sp.]